MQQTYLTMLINFLLITNLILIGNFASSATLPTLPQSQVDISMPVINGQSFAASCSNFQSQINAAAAADVSKNHEVVLAVSGSPCLGPFTLPAHIGTGWVVIRSANLSSLPPQGTRVSIADANQMPQIKYGEINNYVGAFSAMPNAQRYRIIGMDMIQNSTFTPNWYLIRTGMSEIFINGGISTVLNTGYIIIDRSIMRDTDPAHFTNRAVLGDAEKGHTALIDSYIAGIKYSDRDTQAWLSISNPGPILIKNNFLEASGENVMFCGGTPYSEALMPKDATITLNTFTKNSAWAGLNSGILVKTLIELKCGVRILIEGNDFKDMPGNDGGFVFRFTVRNETGQANYSEVSDVWFRHNKIYNVCNGVNMFGADDQGNGVNDGTGTIVKRPSKHVKRAAFTNNLWYGLGSGADCNDGVFFRIVDGASSGNCTDGNTTCKVEDLTIAHNTVDDIKASIFCITTNGQLNLDYKDNLISANNTRGVFDCGGGTSANSGTQRLSEAFMNQSYSWLNNIIVGIGNGESVSSYPQGTNSYPASATSFMWNSRTTRDYTLQSTSPAKGTATDGTDRGVNFIAFNAARSGANTIANTVTPKAPTRLRIN